MGLLGHSVEKEASRAVRADLWPISGRSVCLKVEVIASR